MSQPLIVIVILNTNRRDDTLACLASIEQSTYTNYRVIVLDNASSDGSAEAIRRTFPSVHVIDLTENRGYAGNNNVGIQAALDRGAEWVLVLNEDTIVDPDCLTELERIGRLDPGVGMLGPMVYHYDEPTVIQSGGGRLGQFWESLHIAQNQTDTGQLQQPHVVDWLTGCSLLVRRDVITQVGMIDERFFYYWEETEWCLRARRAGWRLVHVPQAKLWHKGVQRNYRPKPAVAYYNTRNQLFMMLKHRAPLRTWLVVAARMVRTLLSMSIRPKWRSSLRHRDAMALGAFDFMRRRWGRGPF